MIASRHFGAARVRTARQMRFNPIRSLTPATLATQLDQFETGYLAQFALTADAIRRRDDMVGPCLLKREKAVSRRAWNILVNEGLDEAETVEAARHQAALQFFFDQLTATHALDQNQRGGASLLFRQMMRAVSDRYAVHELVWEPRLDPRTGENRLTATFTHVPLWFFENITGRLRFLADGFYGGEGQEMAADEWLVTVGDGIMQPLSVAWMYKRLSLQDWVAYNEKFGMPGIHGKTDATEGSAAWDTMVEAVEAFSQDFSCVTNRDAEIVLIEAKGGGSSLPFPPLVERMDRAIAAICRGADLSTMSAGTGEGSGASLQGDESIILEEDDAQLITEALEPVCATVIRQLFGTDTPLVYLQITVPRPKTTSDTITKLEFATKHGLEVAKDFARQELDLPSPPEDAKPEDLLEAPAPAMQVPGVGNQGSGFPRSLANAAETKAFRATALAALAQATADDLLPLRQRLEAINRLPDDRIQGALMALRLDFPRLAREILARDETRAAWEKIFGTALVEGAATAAKDRAKVTP